MEVAINVNTDAEEVVGRLQMLGPESGGPEQTPQTTEEELLAACYGLADSWEKAYDLNSRKCTEEGVKQQFEKEVTDEVFNDYLYWHSPEETLEAMETKYGHLKYRSLLPWLVHKLYSSSEVCSACGEEYWQCDCESACECCDDVSPNWNQTGL